MYGNFYSQISFYVVTEVFICQSLLPFLVSGMGAPLVGVAPIFALSFMGFGIGKKIQQSHADEVLNLGQVWPLTQFYYLCFMAKKSNFL